MKVIFVNRPLQGDKTDVENIQLIDGEIKHWCVVSEMLKVEETFQQWWERKQEWINNHSQGKDLVEGIYFYDIQSVGPMIMANQKQSTSMIIRYDWIKK